MVIIMDLNKTFGKNLKYYRFLRGFTQKEFSEKVNLSITHISNIENGKNSPSFDKIETFVNVLNIPASYLFDDKINLLNDKYQ